MNAQCSVSYLHFSHFTNFFNYIYRFRKKCNRRSGNWLQIFKELQEEDDSNGNIDFDGLDASDDIDYEPADIEVDNHDSESEEEMDCANDASVNIKTEGNELQFYVGKDGKTIWASQPVKTDLKIRAKNAATTFPGPKAEARQCKTEMECFSAIISADIIDIIVRNTNIFIEGKRNTHPISRERDYNPTNRLEISAILGALLLMGAKRGNRTNLSEFFAVNGTGLSILRANFSENRFRFLMRCLRFDDVNTRKERMNIDRLAPIRELFAGFIENCQKSYTVGDFVTVDEMLVPFKGKCSFVRHMAKKSAKWGIKLYALCDAHTFYTYNLEIYCGKQTTGPFTTAYKPYDVVARLVEPIKHSNRNITTDNYFSSYPLAEYLLANGLTFLGTLKKDQKEIPADFTIENNKLMPGSFMFGAQYDKTLVSMPTKQNKIVIVLSTMHNTDETESKIGKPYQIVDYDDTKCVVDTVDLMCSRYSSARTTRRWPVVVFFRLLDIAGINSFMIFRTNNPQVKTARQTYTTNLALSLMEDNLKYRATLWHLPQELQCFLKRYKQSPPTKPPVTVRAGICYCCGSKKNNRTAAICSKCGRNICKKHSVKEVTCHQCVQSEENEFYVKAEECGIYTPV